MYRNLFQGMDLPLIRVSLLFESHLNAECHGNAVNQLRIYEQSMQYSTKHGFKMDKNPIKKTEEIKLEKFDILSMHIFSSCRGSSLKYITWQHLFQW